MNEYQAAKKQVAEYLAIMGISFPEDAVEVYGRTHGLIALKDLAGYIKYKSREGQSVTSIAVISHVHNDKQDRLDHRILRNQMTRSTTGFHIHFDPYFTLHNNN
jgi:hypothetical protein